MSYLIFVYIYIFCVNFRFYKRDYISLYVTIPETLFDLLVIHLFEMIIIGVWKYDISIINYQRFIFVG